jgi:hypothetical protein
MRLGLWLECDCNFKILVVFVLNPSSLGAPGLSEPYISPVCHAIQDDCTKMLDSSRSW